MMLQSHYHIKNSKPKLEKRNNRQTIFHENQVKENTSHKSKDVKEIIKQLAKSSKIK